MNGFSSTPRHKLLPQFAYDCKSQFNPVNVRKKLFFYSLPLFFFSDATFGGLAVVGLFGILIERPMQNGVLHILITHT